MSQQSYFSNLALHTATPRTAYPAFVPRPALAQQRRDCIFVFSHIIVVYKKSPAVPAGPKTSNQTAPTKGSKSASGYCVPSRYDSSSSASAKKGPAAHSKSKPAYSKARTGELAAKKVWSSLRTSYSQSSTSPHCECSGRTRTKAGLRPPAGQTVAPVPRMSLPAPLNIRRRSHIRSQRTVQRRSRQTGR